jgi:hypothetical protein
LTALPDTILYDMDLVMLNDFLGWEERWLFPVYGFFVIVRTKSKLYTKLTTYTPARLVTLNTSSEAETALSNLYQIYLEAATAKYMYRPPTYMQNDSETPAEVLSVTLD